jgi:carbon-monoxide dehydrogenase medium subunit/xanthine dehydrogenase FAD-binding subunit
MQDFQFHTPGSLEEALDFLQEKGERCKIIAGGTDLIPALRNEDILPAHVLNILDIDELGGISEGNGLIRIGPITTFTEMIQSDVLNHFLPILVEAASWVGGPTIRNRGTVGGNICNASPAADVLPAVIALDGELELQSKSSGSRTLKIAKAIEAPYKTRFSPDEILTGILIEKLPDGTGYAFEKLARRNAMARAYMSLSIVLRLEEDGTISDIRIVPGAIEAVARRVTRVEEFFLGKKPEDSLIEEVANSLIDDLVGVWIPQYKLPVLKDIFRRNLKRALGSSQG